MGNRKPVILLVDDEADITTVFKRGLEAEGLSVDTFNDPQEVLSNFKLGSYDLLLLDVNLPGMTGFELYRRLEAIDPLVKICFFTAFEMYYSEFRKVFPKIKVNCFVRKPVSISELARIILSELGMPEQTLSVDKNRPK